MHTMVSPSRLSGRRRSTRSLSSTVLATLLVAGSLHAAPPEIPVAPAHRVLPILPALLMLQDDADKVLTGDHTIGESETVEDIVVVGGDLRIRGEVTGDAVVVGGNLIVEETGSVLGDAVVTGGKVINRGGRILGEMRMLSDGGQDVSEEIREAIIGGTSAEARRGAAHVRREAAREAREAARMHMNHREDRSWFDPIKRGFAGLISTLALGLVLAGIGAALIFYGRSYLETVSDTLRKSTMRSMGVGLAACFLVVPAFVVLLVALAVSIVGIPLLLLAVPLYPLAVAAAVGLGLLGAAHAIGERTAEQRSESFELRHRNAYAYLFTGLGMLLMPLLAANLIGMTGFLSFLGTLIKVVTWAAIWAAATAGLGAVILSRAGTQRTFTGPVSDPGFESDPLFDEEFTARGPHA